MLYLFHYLEMGKQTVKEIHAERQVYTESVITKITGEVVSQKKTPKVQNDIL